MPEPPKREKKSHPIFHDEIKTKDFKKVTLVAFFTQFSFCELSLNNAVDKKTPIYLSYK